MRELRHGDERLELAVTKRDRTRKLKRLHREIDAMATFDRALNKMDDNGKRCAIAYFADKYFDVSLWRFSIRHGR